MSRRLFHLAPPSALVDLRPESPWRPPSLAGEGFVHLSFAEQLAGTLAVHFAPRPGGVERLALVELDPARIAANLRLEPSRGGADFPHLYREVRSEDVLGAWLLERDPDGVWKLPRLGADAVADDPARSPAARLGDL